MGLLNRMSTTVAPGRLHANTPAPRNDFWYTPEGWLGQMTAAGVTISPELALTLSAVWRAVFGITSDFSTLPCQVFEYVDERTKMRSRTHPLAYQLRWQPNYGMTAQQMFGMTVGHQLLRGNAYWELVPGPNGFADQIIPRHPDRVRKLRLPSGRPLFKVTNVVDPKLPPQRDLTADEMVHLPDLLTFDGWLGASRIAYGMQSFGGMLAAEQASQAFFKSGMTTAAVLTHKGGEMDEEELKNTHASLQLFTGAKNMGGFLIIEEDMTINKLGVDPEQAQLLSTRQDAVKHVARWFGYPGHKLEVESQTQAYAAREQANIEYIMNCPRPIAIGLEQIIQKDLILEKDRFFVEFLIEALFRGDMKTQAAFFKDMIRNRVYNPNEVRQKLNLNPYPGGDEYCPWNTASAADNGSAARRGGRANDARSEKFVGRGRSAGAGFRAMQLALEAGQRVIRREVAGVTRLAKQHANDPEGWKTGLRTFYEDHARFVAQTLKVSLPVAREYAAEHGLLLEQSPNGVDVMADWEWTEAHSLAQWALEGEQAA